jgi:type I restriction enzyme S subunit
MTIQNWKKLDISPKISFIKGKAPKTLINNPEPGYILYLTPELLRGNSPSIEYCSEKESISVSNNEVIILWDGSNAGEIFKAKTGALASTMARINIQSLAIESSYLFYFLKNYEYRIKNQVRGSGIPHVDRKVFSELPNDFPLNHSEQRKIAEILNTVEYTIEQTEALIRKYRRIKQGLLQVLLTRGVDENGELRQYLSTNFQTTPVGKIPKSWRIGSITDFAINYDSKRIPLKQEDRAKRKGDYPYYGASGIIDWIDDFIFNDEYILIGEDGENVISRNLPLAFRVKGKCWVNNHAHVYKPLINVDITFLEELLESIDYSRFISGSAQPKLTQSILSKIPLPIPPPEEQQRIGSIIDVNNNLLINEQIALQKFQVLKQGLMQDLLTGKVRLNYE